jgi:dTDP-4-dehydrorhamnose 3,5-epimerase
MIVKKTTLVDCKIVIPRLYKDNRGSFAELYNWQSYKKKLKIDKIFLQDNISISKKNVLRGLHFQLKKPQGKLIKVISGKIFDVAVDLRPKSITYKKYFGIILSSDNNFQLWIPEGFAHGFYTLSNSATVLYKCTSLYEPSDENTVAWNDNAFNIKWPFKGIPIQSKKDKEAKKFFFLEKKIQTYFVK